MSSATSVGAVQAEDVPGAVDVDVELQGVRAKADPERVGRVPAGESGGQVRHRPEGDHRLFALGSEGLAGAEDERHALPAPVVDVHLHLGQGLGVPVRVHALFRGVIRDVLAAEASRQVARPPGTVRVGGLDAAGPQDGGDGVAEVALADGSRRLDGQQRHDLQQVALDHVPQRARAVVVACTALQGQILIEDDFHLGDVVAAPDRLQEVVGEPQAEDVQDGGLAQKMVHPVDVVLRNKGQAVSG